MIDITPEDDMRQQTRRNVDPFHPYLRHESSLGHRLGRGSVRAQTTNAIYCSRRTTDVMME
jgi:hypothetical protein